MNILLIVPPSSPVEEKLLNRKIRNYTAFPYGLLSMATYVKRNSKKKLNIEVLDCNVLGQDYLCTIQTAVKKNKPNIIGLSIMFDSSFRFIRNIISVAKPKNKNVLLVAGGAATTPSYKEILSLFEEIDGIAFSEGEIPFLELVNQENPFLTLSTHPSWITRNKLSQNIAPQKTLIENLDEIIDIDYSLINIENYNMEEGFSPLSKSASNEKRKQFFVISSRGCPFKCSFCMRSSDDDKRMRYATPEKIVSHVKYLINTYGLNVLTFYDDQILLNKRRAKILFRELAQFNIRIECPNGLSVAFIDDELARLMRKAGVDTAILAIESGSKYVLEKLMNKPLKLEMVKPVIDILRKNGFWVHGLFVYGLPGETDEHRKETLEFLKSIELDWAGYNLAVPTRGSKLYKICVENGYINGELKIDHDINLGFIIETPEYSPEYVSNQVYLINLEINFVHNYRFKNKEYEIAELTFREVIKKLEDHAFAHYHLSKCLENIEGKKHLAKKEMDIFWEIIERDPKWREYAEHFKLI